MVLAFGSECRERGSAVRVMRSQWRRNSPPSRCILWPVKTLWPRCALSTYVPRWDSAPPGRDAEAQGRFCSNAYQIQYRNTPHDYCYSTICGSLRLMPATVSIAERISCFCIVIGDREKAFVLTSVRGFCARVEDNAKGNLWNTYECKENISNAWAVFMDGDILEID